MAKDGNLSKMADKMAASKSAPQHSSVPIDMPVRKWPPSKYPEIPMPKGKWPPYKYPEIPMPKRGPVAPSISPSREDPAGNFNFVVELSGVDSGHFQEVGGLTAEIEPIEFIAGDDMRVRKIPGRAKYSNITLKRGVIASKHSDLWKWIDNIMNGVQDRRSGSIILRDDKNDEILRYNFHLAFPVKWTGLSLNSSSTGALTIEEIELACEYFTKA